MLTPTTRRLTAVLALASLGVVAACSSSSSTTAAKTGDSTSPDKTEAKATGTTAGKATGTTVGRGTNVTVGLKEWEFTPSATSAPAGAMSFTAQNDGKEVHELVLFKTDLDPAGLPLDEEGAVDERAPGIELIEEVEDVEPGTSKTFAVDNVAPGKYVLVCNTVDKGEKHYGHKMYSTFTVS